MPLETGSYIGDLVTTNPASSDTVGAGDDHLRLIKSTLKATFPFVGGPAWRQRVVAASTTITASTENMTHFITTDTLNLNLPVGATAGDGWVGVIYPLASGTTVHLVPAGTDTINAATATASVQFGTVGLLFGTGGAWYLHKVPRYVGNALFVPGGATISGTVVMTTGPLIVQGPATISALAVTAGMRNDGATTLSGSVQLLTSLNVQGPTTLSGATVVNDSLNVRGTTTLSGAVLMASTVNAVSDVIFDASLNVRGTTTLSGNVLMASALDVNGNAVFNSTLNVRGTTTLSGAVLMAGDLTANGNIVLGASLNVLGTTTLSGAVLMASTLQVNGSISSGGQLVYTRGNILGTVSQSGGTPTGAAIEYGTNVNGSYTRFADGTQLCYFSSSSSDINVGEGSIFKSADITWTFPAVFSSLTSAHMEPLNFEGTWGGSSGVQATTGGVFRAFRGITHAGAFNWYALAIGRWF